MSRKYKFGDNDKLYFISFAVVYWIDLFIRKEYKEIVIESWKYCQKEKDLEIYGWCIMSSHVPNLVQVWINLSEKFRKSESWRKCFFAWLQTIIITDVYGKKQLVPV